MSPSSPQASSSPSWIPLTEATDWSRLLYPNPVCFLCTSIEVSSTKESADFEHHDTPTRRQRNVMTISWLTATNNSGRFLMSLHKRRFTTKFFQEQSQDFCLCVPTTRHSQLVLDVGKVSGHFGSKFTSSGSVERLVGPPPPPPPPQGASKRQRRQWEQSTFAAHGIPGLVAVDFETATEHDSSGRSLQDIFYIEGTVARMHCQVLQVVEGSSEMLVDEDHVLVAAQVCRAYCRTDFWRAERRLFGGKLLTFLGSQTFGAVVPLLR